jgi:hypothetical protein
MPYAPEGATGEKEKRFNVRLITSANFPLKGKEEIRSHINEA